MGSIGKKRQKAAVQVQNRYSSSVGVSGSYRCRESGAAFRFEAARASVPAALHSPAPLRNARWVALRGIVAVVFSLMDATSNLSADSPRTWATGLIAPI